MKSPRNEDHNSGTNAPAAPLLLTARQADALCGKSERSWRAWDVAGKIPQPIRVGRSTLWRYEELRDWVNAGCPDREAWETRQCLLDHEPFPQIRLQSSAPH